MDYDRTRTAVKRLTEKPSDDPQKLIKAEAEMNTAKNIYEPIHQQLMTEIPLLINMQVKLLQVFLNSLLTLIGPLFESFF